MPKTPNEQYLEELYELSVANAILIDEQTGLDLYSVSLESHAISQTVESELVKAGHYNDTFLEIKKDKEITIELVDIQQKRDWEALKLGGALEEREVEVYAIPRNYKVEDDAATGVDARKVTLQYAPAPNEKPLVYLKPSGETVNPDHVEVDGTTLKIKADAGLPVDEIVFVGSYKHKVTAETVDIHNATNVPHLRLELDIQKFTADNRVKYMKKVVFYRVSLGEDFSMDGTSERTKQTSTHTLTVLKHPDYDTLGFITYIPVD